MSAVYDDQSIKVLKDVEHVRLRSSMYLDSSQPTFQMFDEIFSNALDEVVNGHSDSLYVKVDYDSDEVEIEDHGRGLPQGINKDLGISTIEVIYGKLNSGGKYNRESYAVSGGLNGVGSCVVNSLSERLEVFTWRDGKAVRALFSRGYLVELKSGLPAPDKKSGTIVKYSPDQSHKLFDDDRISKYEEQITHKISLVKTLLPNVDIVYNGTNPSAQSFYRFLPKSKDYIFESSDSPSIVTKNFNLVMNWSKDNNRQENISYCNFIYNKNGGDHEKGVGDAVSEYFGDSDALLGLKIALSVFYPDVEYDSQAKIKAISRDLRQFTREKTLEMLKKYFKDFPDKKNALLSLIKSKRTAIDKRNNKSNVVRDRKSSFLSSLGVEGFSDCSTSNRAEAELYICEGLSAAGSLKQARNVKTQAVLPLRGKVINAYTSDMVSLLKNREVVTLISNIDVGVFDDVNVRKSRYGKIIICTDADPDGKNIAVLLISLFMKTMPELVKEGYIYLALPPLYGTTVKGKFIPINSEEDKEEYLRKGNYVQRYKGLGEMNPEQLFSSVMDGETRTLVNVSLSEDCSEVVARVSGGDSSYRREILMEMGVLA